MSLITPEYCALNRQLHESNVGYGTSGHKWAQMVDTLARVHGAGQILDYGCGRQTLGKAIAGGHIVRNYDPAIPGLDDRPYPADFVVCTDVLEHIEPECLDEVLNDLKRLARKLVFLVVATRPAKKILADGRNAHLIQEAADWWLPKLMARWDMRLFQGSDGEFAFMGLTRSKQ